ncbi:MAG: PD40 domain-containing protein, partial [Anaerolineae bacterium]|nr:PD40 domain-containing protein [Anaerolineae bacterium]
HTPTNTATHTATSTPSNTPTNTLTPTNTPHNFLLNIAGIECYQNEVRIHFAVLNVPDGVTPGPLTYTYGTIASGTKSGNAWDYYDYKPDGVYNVTSASVDVAGATVTLNNPGEYSGDYRCRPTETPTSTATPTATNTPQPALDVTGECTANGIATWRITNNGGAMSAPEAYTVNGPSGAVRSENFQLGAGESLVVTVTGVQGILVLEIPTRNISVATQCAEPNVSAQAVCSENLIATFTISNAGPGDMLQSRAYRVEREDGAPLTSGTVQLAAGQTTQFPVAGVAGKLTLTVDGLGIVVDTTCAEKETPTPTPSLPTPTPQVDCATWSLDANGFPVFDYTMAGGEACRDTGLTPEPWTPITPGAGSCPIWAVYHTNHTGTWEIFRLGELPDDPSAPANLSQGYEPNIFSIKPSRSPDNEWIAFSTNRSGAWDIWVAPTDGRELPRRVTWNQFAITSDPVWSPGGRYIAYESSRDGNWEIYMFDVTTGEETRLTESDATDINPFWRPLQPGESESTRLVFQTLRDGLWQVYEMDLATLDVTRLSDGLGPDRDPQYSNDGKQIVFVTDRMGSDPVVALMDADATTPDFKPISNPAGPAYNTSWSPDDKLIAYQSLQPENEQWAVYVYELETERTRQLTSTDMQPDDRRDASISPTWYCGTTDVLWASDALWDTTNEPRNIELYTVNALPMDGEPIDVRTELSPLTRNPGFINYDPQNSPSEEDASNRP